MSPGGGCQHKFKPYMQTVVLQLVCIFATPAPRWGAASLRNTSDGSAPQTVSEDMLVIDTDECLTVELIATFRNHTYGVLRSIHPSNIPVLACN
jgi:hypothetical protein